MAKQTLMEYRYASLLVLISSLGIFLKNRVEESDADKQKENLKILIKEAVKEMREEEKTGRKSKIMQKKRPKIK